MNHPPNPDPESLRIFHELETTRAADDPASDKAASEPFIVAGGLVPPSLRLILPFGTYDFLREDIHNKLLDTARMEGVTKGLGAAGEAFDAGRKLGRAEGELNERAHHWQRLYNSGLAITIGAFLGFLVAALLTWATR